MDFQFKKPEKIRTGLTLVSKEGSTLVQSWFAKNYKTKTNEASNKKILRAGIDSFIHLHICLYYMIIWIL